MDNVHECELCGAAVVNLDKHKDWHLLLQRNMKRAGDQAGDAFALASEAGERLDVLEG